VLQAKLYRKRTEIKYLLLAAGLFLLLGVLSHWNLFNSYESPIDVLMRQLARWGLLGVFVSALLANSTVFVCVPYTVLAFTVVLVDHSTTRVLALSVAMGLGAGIGRLFSYLIALRIADRLKSLPDSAFSRWTQQMLMRHPRTTPLLIFVGIASFLPDEVSVIPMVLANYPVRKLVLPILAGKTLHSLILAAMFIPVGHQFVGEDMRTEAMLGIMVAFVLAVMYQLEKARVSPPEPCSNASQPPNTVTMLCSES
jgi:membrane protein DedA with SNARE-associated domain